MDCRRSVPEDVEGRWSRLWLGGRPGSRKIMTLWYRIVRCWSFTHGHTVYYLGVPFAVDVGVGVSDGQLPHCRGVLAPWGKLINTIINTINIMRSISNGGGKQLPNFRILQEESSYRHLTTPRISNSESPEHVTGFGRCPGDLPRSTPGASSSKRKLSSFQPSLAGSTNCVLVNLGDTPRVPPTYSKLWIKIAVIYSSKGAVICSAVSVLPSSL